MTTATASSSAISASLGCFGCDRCFTSYDWRLRHLVALCVVTSPAHLECRDRRQQHWSSSTRRMVVTFAAICPCQGHSAMSFRRRADISPQPHRNTNQVSQK